MSTLLPQKLLLEKKPLYDVFILEKLITWYDEI
jgi:hypothetical protein